MKESRVAKGRVGVYAPDHPHANNMGYVLRSRWIIEQKLGRHLTADEEVHHKDENTQNDDPENLEVKTKVGHAKHHWPSRAKKMNGPKDRRPRLPPHREFDGRGAWLSAYSRPDW